MQHERPVIKRCGARNQVQCAGLILVLAVTAVLTDGCHKKSLAKAPAEPMTNNLPTASPPVDVSPIRAGPQPAPVAYNSAPPDTRGMERVLVGWVIQTHHRPQSFEEFASATHITVPPPPTGKKYSIAKNMHIVLVDAP